MFIEKLAALQWNQILKAIKSDWCAPSKDSKLVFSPPNSVNFALCSRNSALQKLLAPTLNKLTPSCRNIN